jgi:hypothetical protein
MLRYTTFLLVMMILGSLEAISQPVARPDPVIRFDAFKFQTTLPYQQWFRIKGKRSLYKAKADEVILTIRQGDSIIYTGFWWKTADTDVDFDLFVDENLRFNETYTFEFQFFVDASSIDVPAVLKKDLFAKVSSLYSSTSIITTADVAKKVDEAIEDFKKQFSTGSITFSADGIQFIEDPKFKTDVKLYEADVMAIVGLKNDIESHDGDSTRTRGTLDTELTKLPLLESFLTHIGLSAAEIKRIKNVNVSGSYMDAALLSGKLDAKTLALGALRDAIHLDDSLAIPGVVNANVVTEIQSRHNPAGVQKTTTELGLTNIQRGALTTFFTNGTALSTADKAAFSAVVDGYVDFENALELNSAISAYIGTLKANIAITKATLRARIKAFDANFNITFDALVTRSAVVQVRSCPVVKIEDEETTRFSPVVGFSIAPLNIGGDIDYRMFGLLGIKYYFNPVDKRVAEPYLAGRRKRWSVMGGVLVGNDLNYKGQALSNAAFSAKPAIAVGSDFGRLIGWNVGFIFFQQSHVNSIETGSKLRTSPYVSLTIDADLFNRLKSLFAGEKYQIN